MLDCKTHTFHDYRLMFIEIYLYLLAVYYFFEVLHVVCSNEIFLWEMHKDLFFLSTEKRTNTKESIPSNGKLKEESALLLKEELDKLSDVCDSSLSVVENEESKGWVLMDCCFGVPLFDHVINRHICDAIVNQNLWGTER